MKYRYSVCLLALFFANGPRADSVLTSLPGGGVSIQFTLEADESDKLFASSRPGDPILAYRSFIVVGKSTEIKIQNTPGPQTKLPSTPKAAPLRICRCSPLKRGGNSYNAAAFADSGDLVRVESLGDYRGIPLSKITVTPYRFRESEGLTFFPKMRVHIDADLFDPGQSLNEANRTMLIIYPDELYLGALAFKKFKRELGFKVHLYALSSIGKSSAALTHFLRLQFARFHYQYAILIGHQNNMPTHLVKTLFDSNTPTDLPYFLMGEEGDKVPDIHYGRLIAGENADILRQIEKMREYYQRSWIRFSGTHRYVGIASDDEADFFRRFIPGRDDRRNKFPWPGSAKIIPI